MSNGSDNGGVSEVLVRRDVASLGPAAISRLRRAFQVLRERSARDEDDPVGLLGQANIHRDSCSHATWWFLPWHRAYLYYFEQVLRDAAGDPTLTLPYWDWTSAPRLPAAFWGPDNPLNDPTREITPEMAAAEAFVGQPVIEATLETADFVTFASERSTDPLIPVAYGILEGTPHNYIHRFVGGRQGNMANPALAARDPIFWLHHANVDRLWTAWAAAHAGRTPTDPSWLGQPFTFVDAQGRPVAITTAETLDTDRLNYRYDTPPVPAARPEGVSAVTEQAPSEAAPPPGPR
ncbi:MAG: tyrosinase family protein, partial [Chloroflexota bacterium]